MPASLEGPQWWAIALRWILGAIFLVVRLLLAFVAFLIIGSVVVAPFNELLSQQTERFVYGCPIGGENGTPYSVWLRRALVIVREELRRLALYLGVSAGILGLSFVGVAAPIVPPLQLLATATFIALDYLAYPLERRGVLLLRDKLAFVRKHFAACLGFGLLMALVGLIPVVNMFFFPVGAVGGTLLFIRLEAGCSESGCPPR
jgi:CysZ protein